MLENIYGIGDLIEKLFIANNKIWHLETELTEEGKKNNHKRCGELALAIRQVNKERVAIRNFLNEKFGTGFSELKVNHGSETGREK